MKQIIFSVIFSLCCLSISWAEPVLIANSSITTAEISRSDVAKIFLGKKKKNHAGEHVTAFVLKEGPTHEQFVKKIVRKTPSQFATHWKRKVFTGKGQALKTAGSEAEMVELVKKTPGGLGYIDSTTDATGVNQVTIK